jgi:hypothetical protein
VCEVKRARHSGDPLQTLDREEVSAGVQVVAEEAREEHSAGGGGGANNRITVGGKVNSRTERGVVVGICTWFFVFFASVAYGAWETGVRAGYESNVDRAISTSDAKSDSFVSAYLSFLKAPSGESRLNWALDTSLLGSGYFRYSDLSYAQMSISPALVYYPHRLWTISAAPFVEGKIVGDHDQSAFAFGGKLLVREQVTPVVYLTQYYQYKNNRANLDTYSYSENALGASAGINWTKSLFTEVSYEYSRGDSFLTVGKTTVSSDGGLVRGRGRGRNQTYSSAFNETIDREMVDRHTAGLLIGVDLSISLYSTLGYGYTTFRADSGSANCHSLALTFGYRF